MLRAGFRRDVLNFNQPQIVLGQPDGQLAVRCSRGFEQDAEGEQASIAGESLVFHPEREGRICLPANDWESDRVKETMAPLVDE
jgi:hypothetical protein